nr:hypothetical protein GCM10025699_09600 [Microbacterium flavescens]
MPARVRVVVLVLSVQDTPLPASRVRRFLDTRQGDEGAEPGVSRVEPWSWPWSASAPSGRANDATAPTSATTAIETANHVESGLM